VGKGASSLLQLIIDADLLLDCTLQAVWKYHPFWLVRAHMTQAAALPAPLENEVIDEIVVVESQNHGMRAGNTW
jgi:hypothetical protein